jgi:hypothetical protein
MWAVGICLGVGWKGIEQVFLALALFEGRRRGELEQLAFRQPLGPLSTLLRSGVGLNAGARRVVSVNPWVGEEVGEDSGDSTTLTDTMAPLQNLKVAEILEALVDAGASRVNI